MESRRTARHRSSGGGAHRIVGIGFVRWGLATLLALGAGWSPAAAASRTVSDDLEAFGGASVRSQDESDAKFGIRTGRNFASGVTAELGFGVVRIGSAGSGSGDVTVLDVDGSLGYQLVASDWIAILATAGPGWAFLVGDASDVDARFTEDSFTAHVGAGPKLLVTDDVFVRVVALLRWYERSDEVFEVTAGIGFTFQ